jgi:phenylacetate-CoA ligase
MAAPGIGGSLVPVSGYAGNRGTDDPVDLCRNRPPPGGRGVRIREHRPGRRRFVFPGPPLHGRGEKNKTSGVERDVMSLWGWLYNGDSFTAKAIGLIPFYLTYRSTYRLLRDSQWWTGAELQAYQLERLSELLTHAYEQVPYYRRVFAERDLHPDDIVDQNDLQLLPFLTKDIVRKNLPDLRARNYPEKRFEKVRTSGSTGEPTTFYYEKGVSRAREWAFMKTQWERVGFRWTDKCVILRGYGVTAPDDERSGMTTLFGRWLILSSFHMNNEAMDTFIDRIRTFSPRFIQAYPSSITILAKYMKEQGYEPFPSLEAVLCGSENLYPWQRDLLEEVLGCRVYSWYGLSEQVALAGECPVSHEYHIFPEYGVLELVDSSGSPVTGTDTIGEIVGTNLNNFVCPLIRYRTSDLAVWGTGRCACGREYPRLRFIEGRLQEFFVTRTGQLIPVTAIHYESEAFEKVAELQFCQDTPGEVVLNVVKKPGYTAETSDAICTQLKRELGEDMGIELRFAHRIERTGTGKFRYLIQELPIHLQDLSTPDGGRAR